MKRRPQSKRTVREGLSVLDLAIRACKITSVPPGTDLDEQDHKKQTALHHSAHRVNCANIEFLLVHGASHKIKDFRGQTPLHIAARKSSKGVVILVERGADLNVRDNDGRTPLHHAVECEQINNVIYLLDKGANIDARNQDGETVLHLVAKTSNLGILAILVRKCANLNLQNEEGMTAVQLAVQHGEEQNVYYLVDSGAALDVKNEDGETVLHFACRCSTTSVFTFLVNKAVDLDTQDDDGLTVLHDAVYGEQITKIRSLVEKGACIEVKMTNGLTPYQLLWELYGDRYILDGPFDMPLLKLKLAGVPIKRNIITNSLDNEEESACIAEIDRIKSTQIKEGHSLYEIFTKYEKPSYLFDEELTQSLKAFVQSPDFLGQFPIYGKTLRTIFSNADKTHYYLSVQACKVVKFSKNSWCRVTLDVWEHIFSFLRQRDLENFIKSGPTDGDLVG